MIKAGCRPPCGSVAQRAVGREPRGDVIRIRSSFEIVKVARGAILRSAGKAAARVALIALHIHVCAN
jgi:hypothetical protein